MFVVRAVSLVVLLLGAGIAAAPAPAAAAEACFPETGRCLRGRFYDYWLANGGLAQQGYPLTDEFDEVSPTDGRTYRVQYFERARFEHHPEHAAPYDVLLGLLGREQFLAHYPNGAPAPLPEREGDRCFLDEEQRCLARTRGNFYDYWMTHGGLAQQGLPLTGVFLEANPTNGQTYEVQYFERARFEFHPDNQEPYRTLLGLLGREQLLAKYPGGPPPPPAGFDPGRVTVAVERVAEGLRQPLFVTHAGDGSGRLFAVEKTGAIRTVPDGRAFLDLGDRVGAAGAEQGLLGLAFHPRFRENGLFYVNYTDRNGDTAITRFTTGADGLGDPASERRLIFQEQPAANHNGGMLAFGPDGYLYVGLGDGGGSNDRFGNAQDRRSLLGKLLRLDVDRGDPYAIPPDNPFADGREGRPEIWAYGLRNPWRFSFDRATGDLYIADVGQNRYEWVHFQPAGAPGGRNYGWPIVEGDACLRDGTCDRTGLTPPVAVYDHEFGCSITGGYVYRGGRHPALRGAYLYGDYCSGRLWALVRAADGRWVATEQPRLDARISSFGEDEAGEVYLTDLAGGVVYRVVARQR